MSRAVAPPTTHPSPDIVMIPQNRIKSQIVPTMTVRIVAGKPDPRNIYFPYGRTNSDFRAGLGSSLPELDTNNPAVYDLVASIQPFRCNDPWLYDLCSILNQNKHDKLTAQVRSQTETYSVESEHGRVSTIVNNPNVRVTSMPGAVKVFGVPSDHQRGHQNSAIG